MSFLSSLMTPVCFHRISRFTTPIFGLLLLMLGVPVEAAPFTVNTLNDSGTGSLREAINQANASGTVDTITFNVSGTITLASTLPAITDAAGLTIDGMGQTITISGNHAVLVMEVASGATLTLEHLTVMDGNTVGDGGGIYNRGTLTVSNSTFSGNSANYGGGIFNWRTLTVSNSTFSGNSANYYGGGIDNWTSSTLTVSNSTFSGNSATYGGGGIDNWSTLSVSNSTFSGNSATKDDGGGILNEGTLSISNSTFSGNSANYRGGGIYNWTSSTLNLSNSTFSGNSANYGGGIFNWRTLNLRNTILANSASGNDCVNSNGTVNSSGVNLVETGNCVSPGPGILTADPKLGPLANNGGPTQTMALVLGSPAIDAADNTLCAADPVNNLDQRGAPRPYGLRCDIGAYEYGAIASDLAETTTAIPTLSEWSLLLLSGLLSLVMVLTLRRSPNRLT